MSDIVFCPTWVAVEPRRFYNPVQSLLNGRSPDAAPHLPADCTLGTGPAVKDRGVKDHGVVPSTNTGGNLMRNVATLRRAQRQPIPVNKDSLYKPITRTQRRFNALRVPAALQAKLPFRSKPKRDSLELSTGVNYRRQGSSVILAGSTKNNSRAVVLSGTQKRLHTYMLQLRTVRSEKKRMRQKKNRERIVQHEKIIAQRNAIFAPLEHAKRKRKHRVFDRAQRRRRR